MVLKHGFHFFIKFMKLFTIFIGLLALSSIAFAQAANMKKSEKTAGKSITKFSFVTEKTCARRARIYHKR